LGAGFEARPHSYEKFIISGRSIGKFMEIYAIAIIAIKRQFGYKRGSLLRLNSVEMLFETTFRRWLSRLLHNLG